MNVKEKAKQLETCKYIIRHLSIETWRRLPPAYKNCIDLDDLVQDAKMFVWSVVLNQYKPRYRTAVTTFVYSRLKQHLINQTIFYQAQKRKPKTMPVVVEVPVFAFEAYQLYLQLYRQASPQLQEFLGAAVGVPMIEREMPRPIKRFRLKSKRWLAVSEEFKALKCNLDNLYGQFTLADAELLQKIGNDLLFQNLT